MEIILSMTLGVALLLIILTAKKVKHHFANLYLLFILSSVSIGTGYVIFINHFNFPYRILEHSINSLPILLGCFTYLYIKYSIFSIRRFRSADVLHFLPFVLGIPLSYFDTNDFGAISIFLNIVLKICLSIAYLFLSLKIIKKHQIFAKNHFSNTDKIDLKWLDFIVKIGLISYFLYFIIMMLWAFDVKIVEHIEGYSNLIVFVFILSISYYGLTSTTVFATISNANLQNHHSVAISDSEKIIEQKIETKELLTPQKAEEIYNSLLKLMETKKLYRNEHLMLEELAKELNLHSKYVSYVINTKSQKSFFDFVIHFRIQEFNAEVLLPHNKHLTFLAIAFNCGFGSKSAFNRAYKNEMGISPTEFLKQQPQ